MEFSSADSAGERIVKAAENIKAYVEALALHGVYPAYLQAYGRGTYTTSNQFVNPSQFKLQYSPPVIDLTGGRVVSFKDLKYGKGTNHPFNYVIPIDCSSWTSWVIVEAGVSIKTAYSSGTLLNGITCAQGFTFKHLKVGTTTIEPGDILVRSGHAAVAKNATQAYDHGNHRVVEVNGGKATWTGIVKPIGKFTDIIRVFKTGGGDGTTN